MHLQLREKRRVSSNCSFRSGTIKVYQTGGTHGLGAAQYPNNFKPYSYFQEKGVPVPIYTLDASSLPGQWLEFEYALAPFTPTQPEPGEFYACTIGFGCPQLYYTSENFIFVDPLEFEVKVELLSIDACDPENVIAKYKITPDNITLDGTFSVGTHSEFKSGLAGEFEFIFDQTYVMTGKTAIKLELTNETTNIMCEEFVIGTIVTKSGEEMVNAYYLFEGGGYRNYPHIAIESENYIIKYPVQHIGKTTFLGRSTSSLELDKDNPNEAVIWSETHYYNFNDNEIYMETSNGLNPNCECKELIHNRWVDQKEIIAYSKCASLYNTEQNVFAAICNSTIENIIEE